VPRAELEWRTSQVPFRRRLMVQDALMGLAFSPDQLVAENWSDCRVSSGNNADLTNELGDLLHEPVDNIIVDNDPMFRARV
jgi:hypothetical protein